MRESDRPCKEYAERLALLAWGETDEAAEMHANLCDNCRRLLERMKKIIDISKLKRYEPPQELVDRVKSWANCETVRARPVRTSFEFAGARLSHADAFQALLDADGEAVRISYSREEGGWKVLVDAPPIYSILLTGRRTVKGADGRFRFMVRSLKQSGFTLKSRFRQIEIPPFEEQQ